MRVTTARLVLFSIWLAVEPAAVVRADAVSVAITYLGRQEPPRNPLSLVEPILTDEGLKGAEQGLADNQTTGRFLKHEYSLKERVLAPDGDIAAEFKSALAAGERLFVADLREPDLLTIAPLADEAGVLLFNGRAEDDELRTDKCFQSTFHTAPSRSMKTDALAQFLIWKRWPRWFLVYGSHPEDKLLADAYRRSATKFGAKIVAEKMYEDTGGARRTDSGHVQVQAQIPVFTQDGGDYDVLVAADEADVFAEYLPYNSWEARPVAGSVGLVPSAWSRVHEQWAGTQMQRRFEKTAHRPMTERDYNVWVAMRAIGEAQANGLQPPAWALEVAAKLGDAFAATGLADLADSFGVAYKAAAVVLLFTLIPVAFLPRKHEESHLLDDENGAPEPSPVLPH